VRTFTKSQLTEFIKGKLGWSQEHSELVADILFKARTKGAKDIKKRRERDRRRKASDRAYESGYFGPGSKKGRLSKYAFKDTNK